MPDRYRDPDDSYPGENSRNDDGGYEPNDYAKPHFLRKDEVEKMKALGQFKELEEYDVIVSEAEKEKYLNTTGIKMENTEFKEIMSDAKSILDAQEKLIAEKQAKAEAEWAANPDNKVEDLGILGEPNAEVLELVNDDYIGSIIIRLPFIGKLTEDDLVVLRAAFVKFEQRFKKVG